MVIVSRTAMATRGTVVVAVGDGGARVAGAMTGKETPDQTDGLIVDLTVGLMAALVVVPVVVPVAVARGIQTLHATTPKPGSLRGGAAKNVMGVRWVVISCACMCATI